MMRSGASCSPSSYWSSCSYGDRQPITRGKGGGGGCHVRVVFFDSLSLCNCNINAVYLSVFVRYAFSPLLDEESEEEEKEPMMNEAFGQKPSLPPSPLSTCCLHPSLPVSPLYRPHSLLFIYLFI